MSRIAEAWPHFPRGPHPGGARAALSPVFQNPWGSSGGRTCSADRVTHRRRGATPARADGAPRPPGPAHPDPLECARHSPQSPAVSAPPLAPVPSHVS